MTRQAVPPSSKSPRSSARASSRPRLVRASLDSVAEHDDALNGEARAAVGQRQVDATVFV
jgi:hypothetical protein